jgi:hypothetical protein
MEQFAFSGYSVNNMIACIVDGENIYQTDYTSKKLIGKTQAAYDELAATTQEYYDKLVELGVIIPPKSAEQMMNEMQGAMADMVDVIATLKNEIQELKNGHKECNCECSANVSTGEHKRSGNKGTTGD